MPTSRRTSSIFFRSLVSSVPSTTIRPCWCSSSRLMQRIMVDLPEPDGPHTTMRSPLVTRRLISRSTWKSPYHLCTPTISMATSVLSGAGFSEEFTGCSAMPASSLVARGEAGLDHARIARQAVAEDQIENRGKRIAGRAGHRRCPVRIDARRLDCSQEVEDADNEHECRVFEQRDRRVDNVGDGDPER